MHLNNQVSVFIESVLQGYNINEVNLFFGGVINRQQSNLESCPELFSLYYKLSMFTDRLKILKLLFSLKNFLIIELMNEINFGNNWYVNSFVNTIRVKVRKIGDDRGRCFLGELRNEEIFGLNELGEVAQSPEVKLKIKNRNGLIYINAESEALIEFVSLELKRGYEFSLRLQNDPKTRLIIKVNEISASEISLFSFKTGLKQFSKDLNNLKEVYSDVQSNVNLIKKNNSWFLISKKPLGPYFILKSYYATTWFLVTSGFTILFNNIQYSIKYSYIS